MEGSTNSKNVNNYTVLARYYDELLQDEESLSLWLKYIEEIPFKSVLELASGSGVMAGILKRKGYDVTASDISVDMKEASKNNFDGEYLILNMTDYHLDKKFDLILCICDSINYLFLDELDSFFKCAYEHLSPDGRLIFDMHSNKRLQEFSEQYIEEGYIDDMPYQWSISSDDIDKCLYEHFTFYTKDGMIQEHHAQNVFEINEVKDIMNNYFDIRVIEDFVEDEKVLFIGKKKMRIGIVIAIERELKAFLKSNYEIEEITDNNFTCFKTVINNNVVYAIKSGWGLIDAAMATQYLITKYNVEAILNFGVTGALDPDLKVSDLFYVSKCLNYDFDTSSIDDVKKHQYGDMKDEFIYLDEGLIDLLKEIEPSIKEAVDASGDKFIDIRQDKLDRYDAGCNICDMEIVAIARVCLLNDVKCLSIKCISDEFDGDGKDFDKNVHESADKAFKLIDKLLNRIN